MPRATKDVGYLTAPEHRERIAAIMTGLGFQQVNDNETFSSFVFDLYMRVDFLSANSERTRAMLRDARAIQFEGVEMHVVQPEDLIGLKLQATKNRPSNLQDRADIERVIDYYGPQLDLVRIEEYCSVLEIPHELERIVARIKASASR